MTMGYYHGLCKSIEVERLKSEPAMGEFTGGLFIMFLETEFICNR